MKSNIYEFIKTLSENDKKNLTGKGLKSVEEVGELAKAILPYENASGTLHRFVQRREILDAAADVILCALSIAYDLNYSDEEIESMMHEKASKWAGIQAKEGLATFPLPYEIHITVDLSKSPERSIDSFKAFCIQNDLKPIVIQLEKDSKLVMNDVMTSSVHYGDNNTAMSKAYSIANRLSRDEYNVTRVKIETIPWHPAAPSELDKDHIMPENSYFESHIRIVTKKIRKFELEEIARNFKAHISRNYFKKINDDEYIIMMTLRSATDYRERFQRRVEELKTLITDNGFLVDKTEIEFAVHDSNVNHDIEWLK
jgi:NTP pyrophosphatase (non-canonical NTP hydrolase)